MKAILISIHKQHLDRILAGKKTLEVRTTWPQSLKPPFKVFMYETGKDGGAKRIRACAECAGYVPLSDSDIPIQDELPEKVLCFAEKSCLSIEDIRLYLFGHVMIAGWRLENVRAMDAALDDFGIKRPPQSWQYIEC